MRVTCPICGGDHPKWECKKTPAPAVIKTPEDAAKAVAAIKGRKKAKNAPAVKSRPVPSIVAADEQRAEPVTIKRMGRPPIHKTIESLRAAAAERARKYRQAEKERKAEKAAQK